MAFDITDKPYSDAAIIRSVWVVADNALQTTAVGEELELLQEIADNTAGEIAGLSVVNFVRYSYTVPVTTAAYTELIASTSAAASKIYIFDSSGQSLYIAFGAAAAEVDKMIISPGGNGECSLAIPAGTRVSIKAIGTNATTGIIIANLFG